jgi:peptide/nickel transport system substrate-binding protein
MKRSIHFKIFFVLTFLGTLVFNSGAWSKDEVVFTFTTPQSNMVFDSAQHVDMTSSANVFIVNDPLLMPVWGKPPKPWIAESWTISDDGLKYTVKLRQGVKFHDGSELTAEDVAFSMDRMLRIKKGYSWLWAGILKPGSTVAVDKYTLEFNLAKPFGPFTATWVQFLPLNKKLIMKNKKPGPYGEFGDYGINYLLTHDAGAGPYFVDSVELGDHIVFKKHKDYWKGWEENQIDIVNWKVIPERATMNAMLKKGVIDMVDEYGSPEEYANLAKAPGVDVFDSVNAQLFIVHLHCQKKPFDDVNVRKAVSYAFDYKVAVDKIFGGAQAIGPVPIMPGHNPNITVYTRDISKAKEYLAKSKYSPEELKNMELTYLFWAGNEVMRKTGLLLKSNLQDIGLNVKLKAEAWARMSEMAGKIETTPDFFCHWNTAKYPSADSYLYGMFHKKAWGTYLASSWYFNPKTDELIDAARKESNPEKRYALYGEAQKIITDDAPVLNVAYPAYRIAYRDHVKGFALKGVLSYEKRFNNLRINK